MTVFADPPLKAEPSVLEPETSTHRLDGPPTTLSFIVCTRNRLARLKACIASIEIACRSHCGLMAELVVVDNGSTDGTAEWLAQSVDTLSLPMCYVSETRPGLAAARNAGLDNAGGGTLVFVDDDCELHPDYLRDLQRHYGTDKCCMIRGGRVELGDPHDLPFTIKRSPIRALFTRDVHPGGFVLGCNMTMHREVAARVGRFDERFGAGAALQAAEDTDYLVRAFRLGIPIEYVPDMSVYHNHGRSARAAVEALHRSYSLGNGGLYLKHFVKSPWLLRHFYWTLRAAFRELWGGPRFDAELQLSHWPIVFMNLLGAVRFAGLLPTRRSQCPGATRARSAPVLSETR